MVSKLFVLQVMKFVSLAIYLQQNCIEICHETRLITSDEIRIITTNLHLNCAENG